VCRLSVEFMRVKIASTGECTIDVAGTKEPHWARMVQRPTALRKVDLPEVFGPVIMAVCEAAGLSSISFGTGVRESGRHGCVAPTSFVDKSVANVGLTHPWLSATDANES